MWEAFAFKTWVQLGVGRLTELTICKALIHLSEGDGEMWGSEGADFRPANARKEYAEAMAEISEGVSLACGCT